MGSVSEPACARGDAARREHGSGGLKSRLESAGSVNHARRTCPTLCEELLALSQMLVGEARHANIPTCGREKHMNSEKVSALFEHVFSPFCFFHAESQYLWQDGEPCGLNLRVYVSGSLIAFSPLHFHPST